MTSGNEDRVAELASEVLDSFEKLDLVLVLARATAAMRLDRLVADAGIDRADAALELDALVARGVVAVEPEGYSLVIDGPWIEHVRALVALHHTDRARLVSLMAKASVGRIRAHAARSLVDQRLARPGGKLGGGKPDPRG